MTPDTVAANILPLLAALQPYADEFVLIGGWVPQLYREYGGVKWSGKLSLTTEIDAVVQKIVPVSGRPTLRSILEDAGLRPRPGAPNGTIWEHEDDGSDALELFTPRAGHIKGPATTQIGEQDGIAAIALADLDIVTTFIRKLHVPFNNASIRIRVPTLGAYIITKAMTYAARSTPTLAASNPKRGKDLLYIYDIMRAGNAIHAMIQQDIAEIAHEKKFARSLRKACSHLTLLRGPSPHPALTDAAAMLVERDGGSRAAATAALLGSSEDLIDMLNGVP